MARIRVASTLGGTESDRALRVLSRWAINYMGRKTRQSSRLSHCTIEELIESTHARQLAAREKMFERHLPFSWLRFIVGLVSLLLVFSDIFRGGLGTHKLESYYPALHPDEVLGFGTSWNYSVFAATKDESSSGSIKASVWSYKFDSTSISWRAFASYLEIGDYMDCLIYKNQCNSETFDGDVAFKMIDSVVNAVANINTTLQSRRGPVGLTLRSENEYIDRLHQFLLPKWFTNYNWRTNQALYYSPKLLENFSSGSICFPANGDQARIPHFCNELWINLDRSCAPEDTTSRAAGLLYVHTIERLRVIQNRFVNYLDSFTKSSKFIHESTNSVCLCTAGRSQ